MTRVVIIGAGGHGQVVADILLQESSNRSPDRFAFLDDDQHIAGKSILGIPVMGKIADLPDCKHDGVIVAVGDNLARKRILSKLMGSGERIVSAVHPSATIGIGVQLGLGIVICAGVVVNTGSNIGCGVILNTRCTVDHHNQIDDYAHIAPGAHLGGDVTVGEGALVGIGSTIIPGCSIAEWALVGAGSVVTRDVPPRVTVVGVPARAVTRNLREV